MRKNKLLLLLALLMTAATGAWAQEPANTVTWTAQNQLPTLEGKTTATIDGVTITAPSAITVNSGRATFNVATFSVTEGNITKIVLKSISGVSSYPTGWTISNNTDATWTGSAKSVSCGYSGGVYSIEFTIETVYTVTMADDTAEPTLWSASPATDVKKGQTVTVTYTGTKKVIGVKAEKKAATTYTLLSAATTSDYGKVVCAAGHLHDAKTAVPDGCTAVGTLGKVTTTGHGLIIALKNAAQQDWNTIDGWTSASYAGTTLKVLPDDAARGTNLTSYTKLGSTDVSNWTVAQKSDYEAIFENLGSTTGNDKGKTYDGNVNAYITDAGGTAISGYCWSATEYEGNYAWYFRSGKWNNENKGQSYMVRPVLGF